MIKHRTLIGHRLANYCLTTNDLIMKIIRNLLLLSSILLISYSCEPEDLPDDSLDSPTNISAHGDQDDDVEDRKGNN